MLTFTILLLPYLSVKHINQIFTRLFPFERGLYEDKVANFWCTINSVIKLRKIFDIPSLIRIRLNHII